MIRMVLRERDFNMKRKRPEIFRPAKILSLVIILFLVNGFARTEPNSQQQPAAQADANYINAAPKPVSPENKIIDSIEVRGNVYLTDQQIIAAIRSRSGQEFTAERAEEDSKRIAAMTGVEFAYYSLEPVGEKVKLIFVVKEKVVLRKLTFSGDDKTPVSKLTEKLGFQRGDYIDKLTASGGVEKLVEYYNKNGYPFAKVTVDESQIENGELHYTIDKGQRVKIKKTSFEGNKAIKKGELKKVIKSRPKNLLIFQNYFKQEVLQDDTIKLQQAYDKKGYLDTKVEAKTNFINNRKGVEITFVIEEGKQYDVEEIIINGNEFITDANLMKNFWLKQGQFYSNEKAEHDKDEILAAYRQLGFIDFRVQNSRQFVSDNKINAIFDIKEGDRFRIGAVNISGNKTVQDKVIRRILDESEFKPGQWYNANIAQGTGEGQLEKDLRGSVYSETAVITAAGDKPDVRDAEVRIKEGKTGSIIFGAGVSSTDGLIGQVVYEQRNFDYKKWPSSWRKFFSENAFKGAGQTLRIALEPGTEVSRYSISFTEPFLKDKPIAMTLAGSSWARGRESYDEERQKGYVGFTRRMKEGWYRVLAFRAENVDIQSLENDAPQEVRDVEGGNLLGGIKIGFGRNTTDSRFLPTKGKSYELTYEQVVGEHTFGVLEGTHRWYKTLREDIARRKTVLETKLYAGSVVGSAPVFEKFYGGGIGSIRGFDYRGVSPRSGPDDDPIGSKWIATASSEIAIPLYSETLAGLLFVDTGIIETGGIRAAAGIGVQIMIPQWFGPVPMRFELAAPFLKDDEDDTQIFSFSAGALF
ncbi:MAG: Outer membrane protein assembly factor BamA precursor [Planctomycetes bacterium ADurb.Bin401]|nr:MAG: Outer membrane protein assembly factor BamA precursor [Planctomycetes bacterium ADurb.Bin401]